MVGIRRLYNLLFSVWVIVIAPYWILRAKKRGASRDKIHERFARYGSKLKQALTNRHTLWLHLSRKGDIHVCTQLIQALERRVPNLKIIVTSTSYPAMRELRGRLPTQITRVYCPFDRRRYVRKAVTMIYPEAVVLIGLQIRPNLFWRLQERGVPLFLVHTRLAEDAHEWYERLSWLYRPLLKNFAGATAQSKEDVRVLKRFGVTSERIRVVGRYDSQPAALEERHQVDVRSVLKQAGAPDDVTVVVGLDTQPEEERMLALSLKQLQARCPKLFLILAPREIGRCRVVGEMLAETGVPFLYRTEMTARRTYEPGAVPCLVANARGETRFFAEAGDIVFVGNTMVTEGSAADVKGLCESGRAVVFGPHLGRQTAEGDDLIEQDAAVRIQDQGQLAKAIETLVNNDARRRELGVRAKRAIRKYRDAIDQTVDLVVDKLDAGEIFIAD